MITDLVSVQNLASTLASHRELAVDLEADAMHAFRARLCFVQIGTESDVYLLDTLAPEVRVDPLASIFGDANTTKYFHASTGDLQYLAAAGVRVKGLFDTHRAVTLLGAAKVGLADLALERLGVMLKKEHQQSDFSLRPLPDDMRDYIIDDVKYLVEIGRRVRADCIQTDILEEVELDCARMAEEAAMAPDMGHQSRPKVPKNGLSGAQIQLAEAIAEMLHQKRLQWAEAANVPMGRMLSNAAIGAIAHKPPKDLKELRHREGVRGPWAKEHGEEVLQMIADLEKRAASGDLPPTAQSPKKDSATRKREEKLKAWRGEKAKVRKVTASVVLPNLLIEDLAALHTISYDAISQVRWMGPKRLKLYGEELVTVLDNR